jgi:hypothetical protein
MAEKVREAIRLGPVKPLGEVLDDLNVNPKPLQPTFVKPAAAWQREKALERMSRPSGFGIVLDLPSFAELQESRNEHVMQLMRDRLKEDIAAEVLASPIGGTTHGDRCHFHTGDGAVPDDFDPRKCITADGYDTQTGSPNMPTPLDKRIKAARDGYEGVRDPGCCGFIAPQSSTVQGYRKPRHCR